jgi:hypothetical protein
VKTCSACGLPAPPSTLACALCAQPFPDQGPAMYRLERNESGYRWLLDGDEVVSAFRRDGSWDLVDSPSGKVAVTLIAMPRDGGYRVAMVDHRRRAVATFLPVGSDARGIGMVCDSRERLLMAVRSDGPTGIHVVGDDGQVLALVSRHRQGRGGLDLLLTADGVRRNQTLVFATSLTLELMHQQQLVP